MVVCYLKFHPYVDVVKYDNGEMELVNDYMGETLDMTPFIDKLIIEAKNVLSARMYVGC